MEEGSSKDFSRQQMGSMTTAVKADEGCRKRRGLHLPGYVLQTGLGLVWQLRDTTWHTSGGCLYFRTWDDWTFVDNKTQPSSLGSEGEFGKIIATLKGQLKEGGYPFLLK